MSLQESGKEYIKKNYTAKDRILLINPPVFETRYQWVKWNQPLDLLKLSSFLKDNVGCEVRLFDFMFPVKGKVSRKRLKNFPPIDISDTTYFLNHFGKSFDEFNTFVDEQLKGWKPTAVWVTSLTSYWWQSLRNTILHIQNKIQDVEVVLMGNYPRLESEHASKKVFADVLVTDLGINLTSYKADFALYNHNDLPSFCGLDIHAQPDKISKEILDKVSTGVHHFVFFNDNILDDPDKFERVLEDVGKVSDQITDRKFKPKFHGICGIHPQNLTKEIAMQMRDARFLELHFEYAINGSRDLDLDSYLRANEAVLKSGFRVHKSELSGFVNIGLPDDTPDLIMQHYLNLLEIFGFVIPKPFSPTPGSGLYLKYKDVLDTENIELLSPHLFPFSKVNGISPSDYDELYRLTAFMNYPVRNKSFDLFPGNIGYELFRNSLDRKVWQHG